ncbi:hypothetical protein P9112_009397 [Eukaryota sp. TZLM1-RC]
MSARINKEISRLMRDPITGISVTVDPSNNRSLTAQVAGPPGTPYEGGVFTIEMFLPQNYPMEPPKCRFATDVYHMNIDSLGRICLDILKTDWSPAMQVSTVLLSIQSLLQDPNPEDPLRNDLASIFIANKKQYNENARQHTRQHAM